MSKGNKIIRGINQDIWFEAKAQARLEDTPLASWIEEAIINQLGGEAKRRNRLPDKTNCQLCGEEIYKKALKGQKRLIVHHDKRNNRNASVVMLLCDKCHKTRHIELGWGIGHSTTYGVFKCIVCKRRRNMKKLGVEYRKKYYKLPNGRRLMKLVRVCQECQERLKAEGKALP